MPWKYQGRLDVSPSADPLYDFGARLYAPASGTFTQLDSVMGSAQDPLSMNRYLYAAANPATLIDPNGHCYLPDRDAVKPGPCPGETTTTKPPASSPDPGSGIGFGNGRVTYEDDNGQVHSTPANHSGSNSFAGGAVPTPTPSSQTTLQTAVLLAGCGADCRVDETGYVYAATGYFADGTAIPWICVGSIDVRACGAQFADQDASAHIPVGEAVAFLAGGFEATFDELATILGDQAASDRLAGLAANGAEGSGAQFFKGLWEEAAGAASKAAGRVVLAVGAALDINDAFAKEWEMGRLRGRSNLEVIARATIRSGVYVVSEGFGGVAGGALGFAVGDVPGAFVGAGAGAVTSREAAEQLFDQLLP